MNLDLLWTSFAVIVITGISVDLFSDHLHRFFKRTQPKDNFKVEIIWTSVWISAGVGFIIPIYFILGEIESVEYITAYALEKSLSVDNHGFCTNFYISWNFTRFATQDLDVGNHRCNFHENWIYFCRDFSLRGISLDDLCSRSSSFIHKH